MGIHGDTGKYRGYNGKGGIPGDRGIQGNTGGYQGIGGKRKFDNLINKYAYLYIILCFDFVRPEVVKSAGGRQVSSGSTGRLVNLGTD